MDPFDGSPARPLGWLLLPFLVVAAQAQPTDPGAPSFDASKILNGASFEAGRFAPESWLTVYGVNLARGFVIPDGLPLSIDGTSVTVTDAVGVKRPAPLRFVVPTTLSFLAPADLAPGPGLVTITNHAGLSGSAEVEIAAVAPGLFAANEDGRGPVVATFLRTLLDGGREEGLTFVADAIAGTRSDQPIQFGAPGQDVYLSLWGTGFRGGSETTVEIGGAAIPVLASVAHSVFAGLDQAVVGPLPRSLMNFGDAEVDFQVDGVAANRLTLRFAEDPQPGARVMIELGVAVDETERLAIRGREVWWIHSGGLSDQFELTASISTRVDGRRGMSAWWRPRWPDPFPASGDVASSVFGELWPPLPADGTALSIERPGRRDEFGNPVPPRGDVRMIQTPLASNDFTLILEFDDSATPEDTGLQVRVEFLQR